MKSVLAFVLVLGSSFANAAEKLKMSFQNEELGKIIQAYSKASGQKFIVDPSVRGRISIFQPEAVPLEEAFNQLSSALALNGFAISKQGDTMLIRSARNVQRDLIEVSTEKPSLKPERMYTWVYTVMNLQASAINRDLRILSSKDGEMSVLASTNQIIITDWVSNLHRISEILKQIDKPANPATAKWIELSKKEQEEYRKRAKNKED